MKLHHIGIVVEDIEKSRKRYEKIFGIKIGMKPYEDKNMKVKILFFDLGDMKIELIEPVGESGVSRFLEKKGEVLHHLAYEVRDINKTVKNLKEKGANIIEPVDAYEGRVAFIHPKDVGILIEFVESKN